MSTGESKSQLVPFLKPRFAIERIHLELACREYDSPEDALEQEMALRIPYVPIAEHYAMGLMFDQGELEQIVRQDLLNKWDMQFNEGLSIGFEFLSEISSYPFELVAPGIYMASPNLDHNPAKLLLTHLITNLDINGLPVAMVPHVNQVVITGSEDLIGLRLMLEIVRDYAKKPHGMMTLPIVLSNNNWYPFSLTGDHELFEAFNALRLESMTAMYAEQQTFLEQIYAKSEQKYSIIDYGKRDVDGLSFSQAIVNEVDLPALLPLADSFEFRKMEENMPLKRVASAGLERCLKVMSEILTPAGLYPERCKLERFPDKKQCRQMGVDGFKSEYERYIAPAADPQKVVEDVLLLPIYPNSRPKGDSTEHHGLFSMPFLSVDQTSDVSEFYFEALNRSTTTCIFNHMLGRSEVREHLASSSKTLTEQMLAAHYQGRAPVVPQNPMPTPDTYLLSDETQTVSRVVSLTRAQHNGTSIGLSKKSFSPDESRNRSVITIKDTDVLETVFAIPIHESLTPEGPCVNETHTISQLFQVNGAKLDDLRDFYLGRLGQNSWLAASSAQSLISAVRPAETFSVHMGKGIAGELFLHLKRKQTISASDKVAKSDLLLDLEMRLGIQLFPDSEAEGRLQVKERISEQKFVARVHPLQIVRFFRATMPFPIYIPLEQHSPCCWLIQSFADSKSGQARADQPLISCVLVTGSSEAAHYVVRTVR